MAATSPAMTPEKRSDTFYVVQLSSAFSIPAAWFIRSGRGIKPDSHESQSAQIGIAP
jgi:hypothetical protein